MADFMKISGLHLLQERNLLPRLPGGASAGIGIRRTGGQALVTL
jgi:hypothetical protein